MAEEQLESIRCDVEEPIDADADLFGCGPSAPSCSMDMMPVMVLERRVIARSRILLTPFSGDWNIEAAPLKALVDATFQEAGLAREDIDTGRLSSLAKQRGARMREKSPSCFLTKPAVSSARLPGQT